jgi:hypothetical protein
MELFQTRRQVRAQLAGQFGGRPWCGDQSEDDPRARGDRASLRPRGH